MHEQDLCPEVLWEGQLGASLEKALDPGWSAHFPLASLPWSAGTQEAWAHQASRLRACCGGRVFQPRGSFELVGGKEAMRD